MMSFAAAREKVRQILHLGDSPRRTALAFACGVLIAFSPSYGLHTVAVFVLAWAFRLNFLALMAGNLLNNPWTFLPIIAGSMWVGLLVYPVGTTPKIDWTYFGDLMIWDQVQLLWTEFRPYIAPFVIGHILLGLIAAGIGYILVYEAIVRFRKRQGRPADLVTPPPTC